MDWETFYNTFRKPDFIPGFEIQNRLGGGAFGDVYKARKTSIGKAYAIKFLKLEDDAQREAVERELAQVRHFAAIDHPNLVTVEDQGAVMGVPYLIMGYAGEDTLARRLKDGPLPLEEALGVFVQAARGVLALHDRQLVHFDLKPSNVFLKGDVARVGDYGLSKLLEGGRTTLSIGRGTPQYMAPEILRSRADHRADIYSLGVILYESLTGELPYKPEGGGALVLREDDAPPQYPAGAAVPPRVRAVIERCLRLAPEDRYGDVGALLADLGQSARRGDSVLFRPAANEPVDEAPRAPSTKLAAALAAERAARESALSSALESAPTPVVASSERARALVRGLAEAPPEKAPSLPPRPQRVGPVPVPPKVGGGVFGSAFATARIGVEVLIALLAGLVRAGLFAWRALVERLLHRGGNVALRTGRLLVFVLVMGGLGFLVTLLGMVGLLILEQASRSV